MKVRVEGKVYEASYVPFFRVRTTICDADYFKYGIRWPDGHVETVFFGIHEDQVKEMRRVLSELLVKYHLQPQPYLNDHEKRIQANVRKLFNLR